ncbi:MAG: hypothetical protein K2J30_02505, partial [Clostridia bacterium]|nr:hypothetical protein [Clostridia bacterium]
YDTSSVIKNYIVLFIIVGVIVLITGLSVFGLWGTFMRKVGKVYHPHEIEARQRMEELQSEFEAVDQNKSRENALRVFENCIVVKKDGKEEVIDRSELTVCSMIKSRTGIFLVFYRRHSDRIPMNCMLPVSDAYLLKKCLGDKLEEIKIPKSGRGRNTDRAERAEPKRREKSEEVLIEAGSLIAGLFCIAVGIGITLLGHFHVMGDMPAIVGGFPIGIGVLFIVLAFHRYELVNAFLIKLVVAALFIFMGLMFLFVIEEGVTNSPVTVSSLLRHPTVYGLACLFFVSVGISIIPNAIKSLIEYIKYR